MRNFQKAHAARPAEFVRRAADIITVAQSFHRHFADELHGVGEERNFVSLADRMDLAPRLDDAGLVVRGHDADEAGTFVRHFHRDPVHVHHAVVRDGNHFRAFAKIIFRRIVDARMFDGGNPDFVLRAERLGEMVHDHVVRLGRAAGPDDVVRMTAEKLRELLARIGERDARARAGLVHGRRIAADLLGDVQPGFACLAHHGRGGVVIEVNHRPDKILFCGKTGEFFVGGGKRPVNQILCRRQPNLPSNLHSANFWRDEHEMLPSVIR